MSLLGATLDVIKIIAQQHGLSIFVGELEWSTEFQEHFRRVSISECGFAGAIFEGDANFWNVADLDLRYERIDFASDSEYCVEIEKELNFFFEGAVSRAQGKSPVKMK